MFPNQRLFSFLYSNLHQKHLQTPCKSCRLCVLRLIYAYTYGIYQSDIIHHSQGVILTTRVPISTCIRRPGYWNGKRLPTRIVTFEASVSGNYGSLKSEASVEDTEVTRIAWLVYCRPLTTEFPINLMKIMMDESGSQEVWIKLKFTWSGKSYDLDIAESDR